MGDDRALTALNEIRSLELEMAQRLDEARAAAAASIADAQRDARATVGAARRRGVDEAEARQRRRVEAAHRDAERIRSSGRSGAAELLDELRPRLRTLLPEMLTLVTTAAEED